MYDVIGKNYVTTPLYLNFDCIYGRLWLVGIEIDGCSPDSHYVDEKLCPNN